MKKYLLEEPSQITSYLMPFNIAAESYLKKGILGGNKDVSFPLCLIGMGMGDSVVEI